MNACIKTGAVVHVLAYDLIFSADLFEVAGAIVVRGSGPLTAIGWRPAEAFREVTHELHDRPNAGFWRDDLGIFVVPKDQVVAK